MATDIGNKDEVSSDIYDAANRYLYLVRQLVLNSNIYDLNNASKVNVIDPSMGGTAYISMIQSLSNIYKETETLGNVTIPSLTAERDELGDVLLAFFGFYSTVTAITFPTNEQIEFSEGNLITTYDPYLDNIYNGKDWDANNEPLMGGNGLIYSDLPYIPDYKVFQDVTNLRDTIGSNTMMYYNASLIGANIIGYVGVNKNLYDTATDVVFNKTDGTLDFTSSGGLFTGDKILIMITTGTMPIPTPTVEFWRKKDTFTNSTNLLLTLSDDMMDNEPPQVFYNGSLLDDQYYDVGATTILLKGMSRLLDDTITVFYIANLTTP